MYDLILRDATIVTPAGREVADVAIEHGKIAYVGPRPPKRRAAQEISAIGKFLMPGVIDTAVQFDPDSDPAVWEQESKAAVTGGITTVLTLPGGKHPVVDVTTAKARAGRIGANSWCNYGLWGGATANNLADVSAAAQEGWTLASLAYLGSSKGKIGTDPAFLDAFMKIGGVLGVHVDDLPEEEVDSPSVERVLGAARQHQRHVHLIHLSTAAELTILDPVRGDLPVTAGVTPHHLFLSLDGLNGLSDKVKTQPPVRPEHDRKTLWTAMKRGRLDCVASDHHASEGQTGVPSAELLFPLMLSAVKYGRLNLELLVSLCSEAPARIFNLPQKGRIASGADADLILFAEGEVCRVDTKTLLSGAGWSPYVRREAAPKPDLVIVNGVITAQHGKIVTKAPGGQLIRREQ